MSSVRLWFGCALLILALVLCTYGLAVYPSLSDTKYVGANASSVAEPEPQNERRAEAAPRRGEAEVASAYPAPLRAEEEAEADAAPRRAEALRRAEAEARIVEVARAEEDERRAIEQQLKSINAQYKVPEQLMYKRSAQVIFVLEIEGRGTAARTLSELPGQQAEAQVEVSRFVRARLSGAPDMVKITLRGGETAERQFAQFKNVEWVWDVEGLNVGQVDLNLQLLAEVMVDGKPEPLQIKTFQKNITIQISLLDSAKVWAGEVMGLWPFLTAAGSAGTALLVFFGFKRPKSHSGKKLRRAASS